MKDIPAPTPPPYTGRGRVLRIKEGYNPNSSSLGSVVFSIHTAMLAIPALLAAMTAGVAWHIARTRTPDAPGGTRSGRKDNDHE